MKSHSTILAILFGFLTINLFLNSEVLLYVLVAISGISIFSEKFSDFIEKIWFFIAKILSKIVPNILLSIIFYFILTPLAILSRIFNAKTDFKSKNKYSTLFTDANKDFPKESFEKAW